MNFVTKSFNLKVINILLFRFFIFPIILWSFLSLPALYYALNYSDFLKVFNTAYINLNFNYVFLIIGIFSGVFFYFQKIGRVLFSLILFSLFIVRSFDMGLKSIFQISFSPVSFRSTSLDSLLITFNLFGKEIIVIILLGILGSLVITIFMVKSFHKSKTSIFTIVFFLILAVRSSYLLYNERRYSFEELPSYLLVKELYKFQDTLKDRHIRISIPENQNLHQMGIIPHLPDLSKLDTITKKRNIIILYLESFSTNYTKKGGSNFVNLTPNIDLFLGNAVLFRNYFNAVLPTHNSIISSWCGVFPQLSDNYVRENKTFSLGLTCFSDILNSLGYNQNFFFGHGSWYGGITQFLKNHAYERVVELPEIEKEFPELAKNKHEWGIHDTNLSRYVIRQLDKLKDLQPFNLGIFYINTHPPFFNASDCPSYSENKHLQAIHCVDFAVGMVLRKIKEKGLMENTVVVLVGDTPGYDYEKDRQIPYNRTLLSIYSPILDSGINDVYTYSPDLGPTILESMGIPISKIQSGHSILSSRKNFQNLVAPEFSIVDGEYQKGGSCSFEEMETKKIGNVYRKLEDCERRKIFQYLKQIFRNEDSKITLFKQK